jgi:thioredoxin reductase
VLLDAIAPGGQAASSSRIENYLAAGDVRSASMKRVAAAVGEGAGAVSSVHRAVGVRL